MRTLWVVAILALSTSARAGSVLDKGAPCALDAMMPRTSALGGSGAAVASSNEAWLLNPAGLAQGHAYSFELDGAYDPKFPMQSVFASAVDSTSGAVASSLGFARIGCGQPEGRQEGWFLGAGYAYAVGSVLAGGTTRYLRFNGPNGEQLRKFSQDLGTLVHRGSFSFGAVIRNLTTDPSPMFPITATAGVAWGSDVDSRISLDYTRALSGSDPLIGNRVSAGYELVLDQGVIFRGGFAYDLEHKQGWASAGLLVVADRIGVQFAWRRRVIAPEDLRLDQYLQGGLVFYLE